MKKRNLTNFLTSAVLLILFVLYTVGITFIDVEPIGPKNSMVGFATINGLVHDFLGVNMQLYQITDWLSFIAFFIAMGFAVLGFVQLVKRRSLLRVDRSILVLGGFYLLVISAYLFFELYVINYRPVLINGLLEASYPSSTTMLVMCIMPTAMMLFHRLIKNKPIRTGIHVLCGAFTAFMLIGRLLSGVHWFTDIVGGILLSAALVMLYFSVNRFIEK